MHCKKIQNLIHNDKKNEQGDHTYNCIKAASYDFFLTHLKLCLSNTLIRLETEAVVDKKLCLT